MKGGHRWVVFGLALYTTAAGLMVWGSVFPLLNLWTRDLGISRAQGGLLFSLYFVPGILVALPGGWLFDRLPVRTMFLGCWSLIVLGTAVMAMAPNFGVLCAGRLLFAVGMNVHQVGAPKLVVTWFEGRKEFGFATGLFTWGYTIGIVCSLNLLSRIGEHHGWRAAMYTLLALVGLGFLAFAVILRPAPGQAARCETTQAQFRPFRWGIAIWLVACIWLLYNAGIDSYKTFTPDYLVSRGYSLVRASFLASIYLWFAVVLKPVVAIFLKARNAAYFIAIGSLLAILGFLLLLSTKPRPIMVGAILGISIAFTMPSLLALPAYLLGSERAGKGYGLCQLFYSCGFFVEPLIGRTIDRTGGHVLAYGLMSFCAGLGLICAVLLLVFAPSHTGEHILAEHLRQNLKESR